MKVPKNLHPATHSAKGRDGLSDSIPSSAYSKDVCNWCIYYVLWLDANTLKQIPSGAIQDSNTDEYLYVVVERRKFRSKEDWELLYDLSFSIPTTLTWKEWKGFIGTMLRVDIDALEDPRGHTAETFQGFMSGPTGFQFKILLPLGMSTLPFLS